HLLARREYCLARIHARGRLGDLALHVRDRALERPLALCERCLELRELAAGLGALAIGIRELTELERDLLLALRGAGLCRGELGLELGEALLLGGGRLGPLPQLALPRFELVLGGGDLRRARVDLGRPEREALRADEV